MHWANRGTLQMTKLALLSSRILQWLYSLCSTLFSKVYLPFPRRFEDLDRGKNAGESSHLSLGNELRPFCRDYPSPCSPSYLPVLEMPSNHPLYQRLLAHGPTEPLEITYHQTHNFKFSLRRVGFPPSTLKEPKTVIYTKRDRRAP